MQFNDEIRERTMILATGIDDVVKIKKVSQLDRDHLDHLIRCSASVAANYRAATRSRSDSEFYAKICIVLEECDETKFWLTYLLKTGVFSKDEVEVLLNESDMLTRLFASIRRKMKIKLKK